MRQYRVSTRALQWFRPAAALILCVLLFAWGCLPGRDDANRPEPCDDDVCLEDTDVGVGDDVDDDVCPPGDESCGEPSGPGCRNDSQCPSGRYCSDGACVSELHICTILGCNAQRGVCDASQRACVNADPCRAQRECVEGYLCFQSSCQTEDEICSTCPEGWECEYSVAAGTVECLDPERACPRGPAYCEDASTSRICVSASQNYDTELCELGCNGETGLCNRRAGDGCLHAIDATAGFSGTVAWANYRGNYQLEPESSCTSGEALFNTFGADVAFVVNLPAGDTVFASMTTGTDYGAFYIVTDCEAIEGSCVHAPPTVVSSGSDRVRSVSYKNEGNQAVTLYIIADTGFGGEQAEALIEIGTGTLVCGPGTARCNGDVREVCSATGLSYLVDTPCPEGCDEVTAQCNRPENDTCEGAYDIMALGGTFSGSLSDYTAIYNPGSGSCRSAPGREAVFFVDARQGDRIRAEMTSTYDGVLWAMSDCSAPGASCLTSADSALSNGTERITFNAPQDGRYYLIADAWSSSTTSGTFQVSVQVESRDCEQFGQPIGCDGNSVLFCDSNGFTVRNPCTTTCTDGRCDEPAGNLCVDAIDILAAGGSYTGDVSRFTANYNPAGACAGASTTAAGREATFFVEVNEGDRVTATMTSSYDGVLWAALDCEQMSTCVAIADSALSGGTERITFIASQAGRYHIIADAWNSSTSTGTFTLNVTVEPRDCEQFGQPIGCDGNVVLFCDNNGFTVRNPCTTTCTDGRCDEPPGNLCVDAIDILAAGGSYTGDISRFTANYNPAGACAGASTTAAGREATFFVEVNEGDRVTATMTSSYDGVLWAALDCEQMSTCVAIADSASSGGTERITFIASQAGRYHIIADAWGSSTSTGTFTLNVTVEPRDCEQFGQPIGCDGNAVLFCDSNGFTVRNPCTTTCTDGRCDEPAGNLCVDAIDILAAGGSYTGDISGFTANYNPAGACAGSSRTAAGREAAFFVEVNEGDRVTATMTSSYDGVLWVALDCEQMSTCVAIADSALSGGTERIVFIATQTGRYHIIADAWSSSTSTGTFTLNVTVDPPVCDTPGQILGCRDDTTLEYCLNDGFGVTYTCKSTCTDSMCDEPRGDICYDAIALDIGDTFSGKFSDFTNAINPGTSSCIVSSSNAQIGRDAVFAVALEAGDVLIANLMTTETTAGMYILDECTSVTDFGAACLYAAPRSRRLEFFASVSQLYYLVVDTTVASATADFTLSLDIRGGECQPGTASCTDDVLTLCNSDGTEILSEITCAYGCVGPSCAGPETANTTCRLAYPIDGSIRIQDNFNRFRDDYNLQADGCVGARTPGKEAVYQVSLVAGEVIVARATQEGLNAHAVYIVRDCADLNDSCVDGGRATGGVAEASHVAEEDETVFIIVDSTSTSNAGTFILDVEFGIAECSPFEEAVCEDEFTLRTCLPYGLYNRVTCSGGCEEGACLPPVPFFREDFEDGFPANFTTGGPASWSVTTATASSGSSSLQSGAIGNSATTWVEVEIMFPSAGRLEFDWRVSSESGFDYLVFCDGLATCDGLTYTSRISGQTTWATVVREVASPGVKRFRWAYSKDGSFADGQDRGWIDNIRAFEN
jgi:hypothetical protein